ncbi:hypothetical protein, partial [Clostridium perfringens]
ATGIITTWEIIIVAAAYKPGLIEPGVEAILMLSIGSNAAFARWNNNSVNPVTKSAEFLKSTLKSGMCC